MLLPAIIIPVYNAYEQVQDCLDSLDSYSPNAHVLIINDASTDLRLKPLLHSWTRAGAHRQLLENETNRGFVYSVNRGIAQFETDVVLLNSDTLVTPGWLESLAACLGSGRAVATATPWTNNGEIVSFPHFCRASPVPGNRDELARAIKSAGQPVYPELPTAVGFCMAISRQAIEDIGQFDEAAFGRGYGEENDFCMRASQAGMVNVLCDDAYVAHVGAASFGPVGLHPGQDSMNRLLLKHPDYQDRVQTFIGQDPLAPRRNYLLNAIRRAGVSIG